MEYLKNETLSKEEKIVIRRVKRPFYPELVAKLKDGRCFEIYAACEETIPLVVAGVNEELNVVTTEFKNYIVKYEKGTLKSVYNAMGLQLFLAKENQEIKILEHDNKNVLFRNLLIVVKEIGKSSIIYDVTEKKVILTSCYVDADFTVLGDWYLEKQDGKIKAIHFKNGTLGLKSDEGHLEILEGDFVKEIFADGKCHIIYHSMEKNSFSVFCENMDYDLALLSEISLEHPKPIVIGKKNNVAKLVYYNNVKDNKKYEIIASVGNHFEIDVFFNSLLFIKEMYKDKCIVVYDRTLKKILLSLEYKKGVTPECYFEFEKVGRNVLIKMIRNGGKCQAIYDSEGALCTSTEYENVDIRAVAYDKGRMIVFFYSKDGKIFCAKNRDLGISLNGAEYEVFEFGEIREIYKIVDGKRVAVYSMALEKLIDLENQGTSLLIHSVDHNHLGHVESIVWMKYDADGKCRCIYKGVKPLYNAKDGAYFDVFQRFILEYENEKCTAVYGVLKTGNFNPIRTLMKCVDGFGEFIPFLDSNNRVCFRKFQDGKELAVYTKYEGEMVRI